MTHIPAQNPSSYPSRGRRSLLVKIVLLLVAAWLLWVAVKWTAMRVYVPHGQALLVINKYGRELPPDRIVVPAADPTAHKGVQEEVRGPGRYFINPVFYDTQLVDLIDIPAGDPERWTWDPDGRLIEPLDANGRPAEPRIVPMVGLVALQEGRTPDGATEVVPAGYKGVQQEVLTPGVYKINPRQKRVQLEPAVVVPPGSVGVVTRRIGDVREVQSASLEAAAGEPTTHPTSQPAGGSNKVVVGLTQRGVLKDVLQPGIYYLNPRMVKVSIMPVGYDQVTLEDASTIRFLSSDGYQVEADVTVVWGRTPADAPSIVANIGNTDDVRVKVVEQAIRAVCQNEGANFSAQDLIEGETRSKFQDAIERSLTQQVARRNIHILIPLIRNIAIKDATGTDQSQGLLATIQRANIEIERDITNKQKTATAMKQAEHEQALKLVDIATETVVSETKLKVANLLADGQKKAAELDAQREVTVAEIESQIATLDADRTLILGRAAAEVERLKNQAEAKGAKLLVDAFGSPQAYNQYIFAKNFDPQELRLIFAGPGTFWTDLKSFEQVGATQMIKQSQEKAAPAPGRAR